jgi:hypothetical protein
VELYSCSPTCLDGADWDSFPCFAFGGPRDGKDETAAQTESLPWPAIDSRSSPQVVHVHIRTELRLR